MAKPFFRKKRTEAAFLNDLTFNVLFDHYKNIALNTFKWDGLPEGIEERYIERALFDNGKVLFFRDPSMSYMALPCCNGVGLDVYGEPLRWRATGLNYNKEYDRDQCVLIENNKLRTATYDTVLYFVRKLYEASRTMDVNLSTCKIPWVVVCDEKQVLTYKIILQKVDENEPAVFGASGLNLNDINVMPTKTEFIGNDLIDFSRSYESQLLTFLGIDNCPVDKKERLVTDEAQSNNQLITINADNMLEARKRAVEKINALYGLSVSVELRHKPQDPREGGKDDAGDGKQQGDA